ncbi:MAG TPA: M56 family metallopeptidase [Candidatus Angelobacter sp.]|nr:M56 family metallopeptidase [Candidatus Angelobacter sp.]
MNFNAPSHFLGPIFEWTWQTSLYASVLIALVVVIQLAAGKRLAPRWRYALGVLVLIRLLLPAVPASAFSVFNLGKAVLPSSAPATPIPAISEEGAVPPVINVAGDRKIDWWNAVRVLWLLGLTISLLTVMCQHRKFARRIAAELPVTDERLLSLLENCKSVMGVRRQINIVITPSLGTPALFGFRQPRLLLPEGALHKLDDRELRMVFLHELAHVKRGDILLNWVIIFARSLHWFNPLVWLAMRRLRADRELLCDAMVMSHLAADERHAYGNALIKLLDDFSGAGFCPSLAPVINNKTEIKRRVTMIAQFKPAGRIALLLSAAIIVALCCFTFTRAAEKKAPALNVDNPKLQAESFEHQALNEMRKRFEDLDQRAREAEARVDALRRDLRISSLAASGRFEGSVDPETVQRLEAASIEVESNYKGQSELLKQLKEIKAQGSEKLRKVILTANYDPQLGKLLEDLWTTEATLAKLKDSIGPANPEFKSTLAMRDDFDKKVSERIEGILAGLEARAAAAKAQLDSMAKVVQEAKVKDAEDVARYRPYFQAKRDLESLQKVRDALYQRILEREYGVEVPKTKSEGQ